jgi:hypothetical protein
MDKFLKRYKQPKLSQEETDGMTGPISIKWTEFIPNNHPTKKNLDPDGFKSKFYQTLKKRNHANSI